MTAETDELVGVTDIARRHGTSPGTVRVWRHRHPDFPKAVAFASGGSIYRWSEVEAWLRTRGRRNGG